MQKNVIITRWYYAQMEEKDNDNDVPKKQNRNIAQKQENEKHSEGV